MRLWHYQIIPVLPNAMLISQWRECIAIKRQWEKGTLKHRLVSYVVKHNKDYFLNYALRITTELENRKIKYQEKYLNEIADFCYQLGKPASWFDYPEHNKRYLLQNYYNLQEKYDRGIISKKEWKKIEDFYDNIFLKEVDENE